MHADILIITHLPAFYKVGLYNMIAKKKNIYVLFIGTGSIIRLGDFTTAKINFNFGYLNEGQFENRNILKSCINLLRIIRKYKFSGLIVNGWELPEFWIAIFFSQSRKGVALESTVFESNTTGFKRILKKIFVSKLDFALPSGIPHQRLLSDLKFKNDSVITGGVGFTSEKIPLIGQEVSKIYKALYVGRLSSEKNLTMLIDVVNNFENIELSIVGSGPQLDHLQLLAGPNVRFLGHIENNRLSEVFESHHFLILPSVSEPWGLVIEEALQSYLPVIVSDAVGCSEDLVIKLKTGLVFKSGFSEDLSQAIKDIMNPLTYARLVANVMAINWQNRRDCQATCYASLGTTGCY